MTSEELSANAESTSAGDGLGNGEAVQGRRVGTVGELGCEGGELGDTGDAGVFLVELCVDNLALGLADGGENVGLASIVTVGTDTWGGKLVLAFCAGIDRGGFALGRGGTGGRTGRTEVDLLVELVGLESLSDT